MASLCNSSATSRNHFGEVQLRNVKVSFSDELAQAANYFTRSAIVLHDVPQDGMDLSDIQSGRQQETAEPPGRC